MFNTAKTFAQRAARRVAGRGFSTSARMSSSSSKFAPLLLSGGLVAAASAALWAQESSSRQNVATCAAAKAPHTGVPGTDKERTFIAIKPDGVQRGLIAEILARFERKGFKLVALKMIWASKEKAKSHYADLSRKPFFPGLVAYFSSGPIIAMVWEGKDVIKTGRKILGATNPAASDIGTIRGDLCITVGRNVCHGSDGPESAQHEIANWFTEAEVSDWARAIDTWVTADN